MFLKSHKAELLAGATKRNGTGVLGVDEISQRLLPAILSDTVRETAEQLIAEGARPEEIEFSLKVLFADFQGLAGVGEKNLRAVLAPPPFTLRK